VGTLNILSAVEAVRQLAAKKISAEALLVDCLERIASREPVIGAWAHLDREGALSRARQLDRGPWQGMLHGLPIGVKDLIDTVDMPTAYGSAVYAGHRPAWDAPCVVLARAAGAIVLGKTVTTEFATFQPGKTANPHNPRHTPGGSSSGSAAAVADYMVPLAFGTQTAGSVIRPAAFCGAVGFKPTFGTISRVGVKPLSDHLDTVGVLARSVPDAALLVAAVTGRRELLIEHPLAAPPRIGLCRTHEWKEAQPAAMHALEQAGWRLAKAGARVRDVDLPPNFAGLVRAQTEIQLYEQAQSLAFEWLNHRQRLSPRLVETIEAGLAVAPGQYEAALVLARNARRVLSELFTGFDALLAPSATGEAPAGLGATGDPVFSRVWTLLRLPCVNIPCGTGPRGLPLGVQLVGPGGADRETLAAADWAERQLRMT
jgi:Asp-tRNA(Asn)/Glu-tRNA(Gln) amidotransferase A subunit family amidase